MTSERRPGSWKAKGCACGHFRDAFYAGPDCPLPGSGCPIRPSIRGLLAAACRKRPCHHGAALKVHSRRLVRNRERTSSICSCRRRLHSSRARMEEISPFYAASVLASPPLPPGCVVMEPPRFLAMTPTAHFGNATRPPTYVSRIARAFCAAGRSQQRVSHAFIFGHFARSSVSARRSAPATLRSPTENDGPASHSDFASAASRTSNEAVHSFHISAAIRLRGITGLLRAHVIDELARNGLSPQAH